MTHADKIGELLSNDELAKLDRDSIGKTIKKSSLTKLAVAKMYCDRVCKKRDCYHCELMVDELVDMYLDSDLEDDRVETKDIQKKAED